MSARLNSDGIGCPADAPGQKARVMDWLRNEPGGLTQLQALQHLAVARLAAIVYRLREQDGFNITTELVEMPTRYGPATVACYHLATPEHAPAQPAARVPCGTSQPGEAPCDFCGHRFDQAAGAYGCPNCHGEGLE